MIYIVVLVFSTIFYSLRILMEETSSPDDYEEIDLNEFEVKTMKKGSFFILVDELFDQGISKNIIENLGWRYGVVLTSEDKMIDYYMKYPETFEMKNVFKRYSNLLKKRCFGSHMYLLIDCYNYSSQQVVEFENNKTKDMSFIVIHDTFDDYTKVSFDYIIIATKIELSALDDIYVKISENINKSIKNKPFLSKQDFLEVINETVSVETFLVVDTKTGILSYLQTSSLNLN